MKTYHKIQTIFKRDPATKNKTLLKEFSLPEFGYLALNEWVFTEKIDGTNIRIMINFNKVLQITPVLGGKTDNALIPTGIVDWFNNHFLTPETKAIIEKLFPAGGVCLYGEGYGPNIQSGGNYRSDQNFVLFDVKIDDWWLRREDVEDIASKLDLDVVPIIGTGTIPDMVEMTKKGFKSQWGNFIAEGIVARPRVELKTRSGDRVITKIKYKDFIHE